MIHKTHMQVMEKKWWSQSVDSQNHLMQSVSCSIMSNSLQPHGLQPARLLCPRNSPGKNTRMDSESLLQDIFPTQGSNLVPLHCRQILYNLKHQGNWNYIIIYPSKRNGLSYDKSYSSLFLNDFKRKFYIGKASKGTIQTSFGQRKEIEIHRHISNSLDFVY